MKEVKIEDVIVFKSVKYYIIKRFNGLYYISKCGNIFAAERVLKSGFGSQRIIKAKIISKSIKNGYYNSQLTDINGERKSYKIHRLVAETFLSNNENKPYVDHIDTIKTNNNINNLRWVTPKENSNNETTLNNRKRTLKTKKISNNHKLYVANLVTYLIGLNPTLTKSDILNICTSNIEIKDKKITYIGSVDFSKELGFEFYS